MGYLSRLDAVNMMMLAAGESLVADLEEASGIDTGIAEFMLDQSSLEYQLKGQVENRIRRVIEPDVNGNIILSFPTDDYEGVISASLISNHWNVDDYPIQARVEEGNPPKLYNMTDSTDVWDATQEYVIDIVMFLRWEQLDTSSQRAVLGDAMRRYQMMVQGDRDSDRILAEDQFTSKIKARQNDTSDKRRNIFNVNPDARNATYRYPYRDRRRSW